MSKGSRNREQRLPAQNTVPSPKVHSLLEAMRDGREYASIVGVQPVDLDVGKEIGKALNAISDIRQRPTICYAANVVNNSIKISTGIDFSDELPFSELIKSVDPQARAIDIVLVTPGGSAERVAHFVEQIRRKYEHVSFIIPHMAMSAGTIFCLSGDELIMDDCAYIGPIDPQVPSRDGRFVPAQSILTLLKDIQIRGQEAIHKGSSPNWTDIQILQGLDPKEIGNAKNASDFSINLVSDYLERYKFRTWEQHKDGSPVTPEEKKLRAKEIADQLCEHALWLSHARGISRDAAHKVCRLKITHPEEIEGLQRAIKRLWAIMHWVFERTTIAKMLVSADYALFKNDTTPMR